MPPPGMRSARALADGEDRAREADGRASASALQVAALNVEEAGDVCDALSGLHMDRLLAPKTDEEQASSMQDDRGSVTTPM